jgi:hypothetical protein
MHFTFFGLLRCELLAILPQDACAATVQVQSAVGRTSSMDILPYLKTKGISPFRGMVGIKYTHAENGRSQCVMDIDERLFNPGRFVHGGATFAMVDSGMGATFSIFRADMDVVAGFGGD